MVMHLAQAVGGNLLLGFSAVTFATILAVVVAWPGVRHRP